MDTLTPFVFWGQNKSKIFLKVDLRDVTNPNVNLTEDGLTFSAHGLGVRGKNNYTLTLDFYLPIDPERSHHKVTDRHVAFQLGKVGIGETWPRLTEGTNKPPWLKIDFDHFAFDDEEDTEDEAADMKMDEEEFLRKLERDIEAETMKAPQLNMRVTYLFLYNMFQWVGYTYVFCALAFRCVLHGRGSLGEAFSVVGSQLMLCQGLALLEIAHPLLGWVHTGILMPILQVGGRNLVLFCLIYTEEQIQNKEIVGILFMVWSAIEVVRYPFYMLNTVNMEFSWVTWLRYTLWIPLYPLGFVSEGLLMLTALPYFDKSQRFSLALPNTLNFSFHFSWFLRVYMCLFFGGGYFLMRKMYETRKKKLGIKTTTSKQRTKKLS